MGRLNVITGTAGGCKGWMEKERRQIRMSGGIKTDRDSRI